MPVSPPSLCTNRCGTLVYGGGQCVECLAETRRETDRRRPNGYQRGYTTEWAAFRKTYLEDHVLCESAECRELPVWNRTEATDVDHIDGTGRNGARAYDSTNLQALCHSCHSRLTAKHDGGFGHTKAPRHS
jgi:5-methylcytosine-specific restriction protein A